MITDGFRVLLEELDLIDQLRQFRKDKRGKVLSQAFG